MDTTERDLSRSSGRGSMGPPSKSELRWMKRKEKEEAKREKIEKDEAVFKVSKPAVVDLELRNRGVQMEMTRGSTLRKTEKQLGERRSGQHPEMGEGEAAWKGAAGKLKVALVKQDEAKRGVLKTKKRVMAGTHKVKRDSGAIKRGKKGRAVALQEQVEKEMAAMTPVEERGEQVATATSTPKPTKEQPQRQQQQTQQKTTPNWEQPNQRPYQRPHQPHNHQPQNYQQRPHQPQNHQQRFQQPYSKGNWQPQQRFQQPHGRGNWQSQQHYFQQQKAQWQASRGRQSHQPQPQSQHHRPKSVVVIPTAREMKESGLKMKTGTEEGATRETVVGAFKGTKETQKRVEEELRKKKDDEEWLAETKAREDAWEEQRLNHEERMRNTYAWVGSVNSQGKAEKDEERARAKRAKDEGRAKAREEEEEEEEEERDNIIETRFETSAEYGPMQPLPAYPAAASVSADYETETEIESEVEKKEEEKSGKSRRKAPKGGKKGGKGMKGKALSTKPPSHSQLQKTIEDLRKELKEERENNEKKERENDEKKKREYSRKKKTGGRHSSGAVTAKKRSSASDASTIRNYDDDEVRKYEDNLLASPVGKAAAKRKTKEGSPMEAD